jgi:hypothetical protein
MSGQLAIAAAVPEAASSVVDLGFSRTQNATKGHHLHCHRSLPASAAAAGGAELYWCRRSKPSPAGGTTSGVMFFSAYFFRAASTADTSSRDCGSTAGSKRAITLPSRPTKNLVKFH